VLIVAALGWFLYSQLRAQGFDWRLAIQSFLRLRPRWLLISLAPIWGTYLVRALRWAVFLKPVKPHPSLRNLLSATIIGFTAITLFGRPGEFVRPYLIARKERVPATSQLAVWVLERAFDLLMALLVFGFALARVTSSEVRVGPKLEWVLAVGGKITVLLSLAILILLLSFRHLAEPLRERLVRLLRFLPDRHWLRAEKILESFVLGVKSTRSDRALVAVVLYSLLEWVLIAACYWCLARAFADLATLGLVDVLIFMGFVSFGAAVQIPGIGGGIQVVSVVVLTELFGLRLEPATAFGILTWILTFVVAVPFGMILAVKEGLDWHSLRRIGRGESS
jgi:uncharacterized protein (TIRG00374 family)